jgi:hypothetical protein
MTANETPSPQAPGGEPTIAELLAREIEAISAVPDAQRGEVEKTLWGLALSGGGIRSATFALGLLQSLARRRALRGFHYLSTVSGGGYAGAFLQGAIHRFGIDGALRLLEHDPTTGAAPRADRALRHLREYSNYLSPNKSLLSGDTLGMIATYVRNVLLTQSQLLALMLALGVLPLAIHPWLLQLADNPRLAQSLAALCAVLAGALVAFLSHHAEDQRAPDRTEAPRTIHALTSVVVVLGLALAAALGALSFLGKPMPEAELGRCVREGLDAASATCASARLGLRSAAIYFAIWLGWLVFDVVVGRLRGRVSNLRRHWVRFLAGSLGGAVLAGLGMILLQSLADLARPVDVWTALIVGSVLVFFVVTSVASLHVGLVGRALTDLQRELWARIGGRAGAVVLVGLSASLGLLVVGPWALAALIVERESVWTQLAGWGGIVSWIGVTLSGVLSAARVGERGQPFAPRHAALRRALSVVAPWIFVLGLWVVIGLLAQALLHLLADVPVPALAHSQSLGDYLSALARVATQASGSVWLLFGLSLATWFVLGLATDANELSLNAFYRNRLVRCYLGATHERRKPEPITNFDLDDDLPLADLASKRPAAASSGDAADAPAGVERPLYPLIGAAMNLVSAKQLDWQDRRAASFVFTPLYCGHLPPTGRADAQAAGDRKVDDRERGLARLLSLGTAVAISGAAVSPNMGARSSPATTFLLTLFDARLGWWVPNRLRQAPMYGDHPGFPGLHLVAELLGLTHDAGRFAHISDGGHFENLALYELVRRRCRFIVCSDAGADPTREFADLGNAIQKCRVDFGAEIELDINLLRPDPATGLSRRHAVLGKIRYSDTRHGLLLYLKPSLVGDEPADVQHYARRNPEFPHQSTGDQFFDEVQFECYRRLGQHIGDRVFGEALSRIGAGPGGSGLELGDNEAREKLVADLAHRHYEPVDAIARHFPRHSETMARLFATLRSEPALRTLDAQIYPGWIGTQGDTPAEADVHRGLPAPADFRTCFYFCQELIQFMESVYVDLDLENNHRHPDNRGWMNTFRHWSWAPIFRVTWALGAQTYGARFVDFCETRVGIPRITDALDLVAEPVAAGTALGDAAAALERAGSINFLERSILASDALASQAPVDTIIRLCLRWDRIVDDPQHRLRDLTLGIAALSGRSLVLFRIQDHVRRLGLGAAFMRLLVGSRGMHRIAIAPGHYGGAGVLRRSECEALQEQLEEMQETALRRRQARTRAALRRQRKPSADDDA